MKGRFYTKSPCTSCCTAPFESSSSECPKNAPAPPCCILAADVVGYSRLMEQDEAGTLATLKTRRREVLQPSIARHRGRSGRLYEENVVHRTEPFTSPQVDAVNP